jgi:hypothetical protein
MGQPVCRLVFFVGAHSGLIQKVTKLPGGETLVIARSFPNQTLGMRDFSNGGWRRGELFACIDFRCRWSFARRIGKETEKQLK